MHNERPGASGLGGNSRASGPAIGKPTERSKTHPGLQDLGVSKHLGTDCVVGVRCTPVPSMWLRFERVCGQHSQVNPKKDMLGA